MHCKEEVLEKKGEVHWWLGNEVADALAREGADLIQVPDATVRNSPGP